MGEFSRRFEVGPQRSGVLADGRASIEGTVETDQASAIDDPDVGS